jgi:hypothetical protein
VGACRLVPRHRRGQARAVVGCRLGQRRRPRPGARDRLTGTGRGDVLAHGGRDLAREGLDRARIVRHDDERPDPVLEREARERLDRALGQRQVEQPPDRGRLAARADRGLVDRGIAGREVTV